MDPFDVFLGTGNEAFAAGMPVMQTDRFFVRLNCICAFFRVFHVARKTVFMCVDEFIQKRAMRSLRTHLRCLRHVSIANLSIRKFICHDTAPVESSSWTAHTILPLGEGYQSS